jgi:hypothetical protein
MLFVNNNDVSEFSTADESLHELNTSIDYLTDSSTAVNDQSVESARSATESQSVYQQASVNDQSTFESSIAADQSLIVIDSAEGNVQESFYIIDDSQVHESRDDDKGTQPCDVSETDIKEIESQTIEALPHQQDSIVVPDSSTVSKPSAELGLSADEQQQSDMLSSVLLVIGRLKQMHSYCMPFVRPHLFLTELAFRC